VQVDQLRELLDRFGNREVRLYDSFVMTGSVVKPERASVQSVLREEIVQSNAGPFGVAGNMLAAFREGDGLLMLPTLHSSVWDWGGTPSFKGLHIWRFEPTRSPVYNALREIGDASRPPGAEGAPLSAIRIGWFRGFGVAPRRLRREIQLH